MASSMLELVAMVRPALERVTIEREVFMSDSQAIVVQVYAYLIYPDEFRIRSSKDECGSSAQVPGLLEHEQTWQDMGWLKGDGFGRRRRSCNTGDWGLHVRVAWGQAIY